MNSISDRIKSLRKSENLTQKEFAKRLLISQSYLSGLENGNEIPTSKLSKLICLEFGINEAWLIDGSGDMYDTVYENEKSSLAEVSNSALLKILTLLTTNSNVEYGLFANSLDFLSNLLGQSASLNEDLKLEYLECIQNLLMNVERAVYVSINNSSHIMEQHKKGVTEDIEQLFKIIEKIKSSHKDF